MTTLKTSKKLTKEYVHEWVRKLVNVNTLFLLYSEGWALQPCVLNTGLCSV